MNNKKAKELRKNLGIVSTMQPEYDFYTTSTVLAHGVRYRFTYMLKGPKKIEQIAKKIYKYTGMLPRKVKRLNEEKVR